MLAASAHRGSLDMLEQPRFHHLHLNSVDPQAAIDFYVRHFPSTWRTTWAGEPALGTPNDVLVLFTRVDAPPALAPETALWHFGWHVTDVRERLQTYRRGGGPQLLPLFTGIGEEAVLISSDALPGTAGVLGLDRAQLTAARGRGATPRGGPGFAYMQGPDGALVEYAGDHPAERFNHVHLWQDEPFCAQLWYCRHLDATVMAGRTAEAVLTEENCKVPRGAEPTWPSLDKGGTYRTPRAAVLFGDVALTWYARQGDAPLASPRGHVIDHIGLGVADLDAWIEKLERERVPLCEGPYRAGETRAVMLEGPSREAIELIET
jgi:catechol 2,3-dioxygenase-like lactoylglutathione lyase family enzyme